MCYQVPCMTEHPGRSGWAELPKFREHMPLQAPVTRRHSLALVLGQPSLRGLHVACPTALPGEPEPKLSPSAAQRINCGSDEPVLNCLSDEKSLGVGLAQLARRQLDIKLMATPALHLAPEGQGD